MAWWSIPAGIALLVGWRQSGRRSNPWPIKSVRNSVKRFNLRLTSEGCEGWGVSAWSMALEIPVDPTGIVIVGTEACLSAWISPLRTHLNLIRPSSLRSSKRGYSYVGSRLAHPVTHSSCGSFRCPMDEAREIPSSAFDLSDAGSTITSTSPRALNSPSVGPDMWAEQVIRGERGAAQICWRLGARDGCEEGMLTAHCVCGTKRYRLCVWIRWCVE